MEFLVSCMISRGIDFRSRKRLLNPPRSHGHIGAISERGLYDCGPVDGRHVPCPGGINLKVIPELPLTGSDTEQNDKRDGGARNIWRFCGFQDCTWLGCFGKKSTRGSKTRRACSAGFFMKAYNVSNALSQLQNVSSNPRYSRIISVPNGAIG